MFNLTTAGDRSIVPCVCTHDHMCKLDVIFVFTARGSVGLVMTQLLETCFGHEYKLNYKVVNSVFFIFTLLWFTYTPEAFLNTFAG